MYNYLNENNYKHNYYGYQKYEKKKRKMHILTIRADDEERISKNLCF